MTGIILYISSYLSKSSSMKTLLFIILYFILGIIGFNYFSDYANKGDHDLLPQHDIEEAFTNFYIFWIANLRILLFKHLLGVYFIFALVMIGI